MAAAAAVAGHFVDVRRLGRLAGGARVRPFHCEHGVAVPLDRADVDTDQIIPKQFLKRIERTGYGEFLFYDWRYDETGAERPDFVAQPARVRGRARSCSSRGATSAAARRASTPPGRSRTTASGR